MPIDGQNIWPVLNGSTPGVRDELLIGIGSRDGTKGALVSGQYKFIAAGGNSVSADGWSAQYPGSTPVLPAPPQGSCQHRPCLFNLEADPRETKDLVDVEPERAEAMLKRYQALAKKMFAPNGDEDHSLDVECDHDLCWESGLRWNEHQCDIDGMWYDGTIVFGMKKILGQQVNMSIISGCQHCAFTSAIGNVSADGRSIDLVASGKGSWVSHTGHVYYDNDKSLCRIHWTGQNRTHGGQWADFCRGRACPAAPPHKNPACEIMLQDGFWQPYA